VVAAALKAQQQALVEQAVELQVQQAQVAAVQQQVLEVALVAEAMTNRLALVVQAL
jgi:hypothetical protein